MTNRPTLPPGVIETCRACGVSFSRQPGESTSVLVHRYTAWRDQHWQHTLPDPPAESEAKTDG